MTANKWEPQVVTNERRNHPVPPGEHHRALTRHVMSGLAAGCKGSHLRVKGEQIARRRKHQRLVARPTVASAHRRAGDQADTEFRRRGREELLRFAAIRIGHGCRVHGETSGEHLGQRDKSILFRRGVGQQATDLVEIRSFVLPCDVGLKGDDVHERSISKRKQRRERDSKPLLQSTRRINLKRGCDPG